MSAYLTPKLLVSGINQLTSKAMYTCRLSAFDAVISKMCKISFKEIFYQQGEFLCTIHQTVDNDHIQIIPALNKKRATEIHKVHIDSCRNH